MLFIELNILPTVRVAVLEGNELLQIFLGKEKTLSLLYKDIVGSWTASLR